MKRTIQISFLLLAVALLMLALYTWVHPSWGKRWPNDVIVWRYAAISLGMVFLTLLAASLDVKRLFAHRCKKIASDGVEYVLKADGTIVSMRPFR